MPVKKSSSSKIRVTSSSSSPSVVDPSSYLDMTKFNADGTRIKKAKTKVDANEWEEIPTYEEEEEQVQHK